MCGPAPPERSNLENRQATNRFIALVIPLVILGIIGYVTWVIVVLICAHYLFNPGPGTQVAYRGGSGIAILVIYFIIFFPFLTSYFRTIHLANTNPGYVPAGPQGKPIPGTISKFIQDEQTPAQQLCAGRSKQRNGQSKSESDGASLRKGQEKAKPQPKGHYVTVLDYDAIFRGDAPVPPGTEAFFTKDVFVCDPRGLPKWCGTCNTWKPDRAHHCSDVGRCVLNLDHFCPWVSGVVSETNFKFFVQFVYYAAVYCLFVLVVLAYFVSEVRSKGTSLNPHWCVALGLACFFCLFSGSMALKSTQDLLRNLTTVDAIDHSNRTMFLAIRTNSQSQAPASVPSSRPESSGSTHREGGQRNPLKKDSWLPTTERRSSPVPWQCTITYPFNQNSSSLMTTGERHTFAVVETPRGMNPWNLGPYENFRAAMGQKWYDWILPLRMAPVNDHGGGESMYPLGPEMKRLRIDAGIDRPSESAKGARRERVGDGRRRKCRHSHRHSGSGSRSGQRPPASNASCHDRHDWDQSSDAVHRERGDNDEL